MGAEAKARRRLGTKWVSGKALLETEELIFRAEEGRAKVRFVDMKDLRAKGSRLAFKANGESFEIHIDADAEAWAKKIQNPKGRLEKLGVRPGSQLALLCMSDETFPGELAKAGVEPTTHDKGLDLLFVGVGDRAELKGFPSWRRRIADAGGVWVVYPKGRKEVTEMDVLEAGRKAGLKDVKVVKFSETHTGLKFVIPVSERSSV